MIPLDIRDFSYYVPELNFQVDDLYQFPQPVVEMIPSVGVYNFYNPTPISSFTPTPIVYNTPVIEPQPIVAPIAAKTIAFTVANVAGETLPAANIAIDGTRFEQTDINGYVAIPRVLPTSTIKITFQGYTPYTSLVSQLPSKVVLEIDVTQLKEVVAEKKSPKKSSNTWAWWLAGAVAAFGIYKYSKSGTKVVKAKI